MPSETSCFVINEAGVKSTSSWLKNAFKKLKKFVIDSDALKASWKFGRSALDSLAGSVGIPLSQLRGGLKSNGVDPDSLDKVLTAQWGSIGDAEMQSRSVEQLALDIGQAEDVSKIRFSPIAIGLALGAVLLIFLGRGKMSGYFKSWRSRPRRRFRFRFRRRRR